MNTAATAAAQRTVIELGLHAYPEIRVDGRRVELPLKGGLALIAPLRPCSGPTPTPASAADACVA